MSDAWAAEYGRDCAAQGGVAHMEPIFSRAEYTPCSGTYCYDSASRSGNPSWPPGGYDTREIHPSAPAYWCCKAPPPVYVPPTPPPFTPCNADGVPGTYWPKESGLVCCPNGTVADTAGTCVAPTAVIPTTQPVVVKAGIGIDIELCIKQSTGYTNTFSTSNPFHPYNVIGPNWPAFTTLACVVALSSATGCGWLSSYLWTWSSSSQSVTQNTARRGWTTGFLARWCTGWI